MTFRNSRCFFFFFLPFIENGIFWSVAGRTYRVTATLGYCQQVFLDHSNSVGFGVCRHDVSPDGAVPQLVFPSVSVPFFLSLFFFWTGTFIGKKTLRWMGGPITLPSESESLTDLLSPSRVTGQHHHTWVSHGHRGPELRPKCLHRDTSPVFTTHNPVL